MMKLVLLLVSTFFYCSAALAQKAEIDLAPPSILELKAFLAQLKGDTDEFAGVYSDSRRLEELLHKLQPSVYLYGETLKVYGESPSNLFTDIGSLGKLNDFSFEKNHIEIATIRINDIRDLNSVVDLSIFSDFTKLKYICIVSRIAGSEQSINTMIRGSNHSLSVFYKIDKGDSE